MRDETGGTPFPEGDDHGGADEEFASVVFDQAFVRAARIHEPSAQERILSAAQARAEEPSSAHRRMRDDEAEDEDGYPHGRLGDNFAADWDEDEDTSSLGYRRTGHSRWHRMVAWLLAVLMGFGVVALTVAAVYRGAVGGRQQPAPTLPGNSRVDSPTAPEKSAVPDPVAPAP